MLFDSNSVFGIHEQALLLKAQRSQVLANNLANADTPGFQARDMDFQALLADAMGSAAAPALTMTQAAHMPADAGALDAELMYRQPLQGAVDGNTVDAQMEKSEFLQNSLSFQASYVFLNGRIHTLMAAIRGE